MPGDDIEALHFCHDEIIRDMDEARDIADRLELMVDKKYWPFPTYADLLFSER